MISLICGATHAKDTDCTVTIYKLHIVIRLPIVRRRTHFVPTYCAVVPFFLLPFHRPFLFPVLLLLLLRASSLPSRDLGVRSFLVPFFLVQRRVLSSLPFSLLDIFVGAAVQGEG